MQRQRSRTIEFYDDDAADAYERAVEDLESARRHGVGDIEQLTKNVLKALMHLHLTAKRFRFQALPRAEYRALIAAHPPTEADHQQVKAEGGNKDKALWSVEGFPRALVQACCVEPVLDDDDIAEIFDGQGWNDAEVGFLFAAAQEVNTRRRIVAP